MAQHDYVIANQGFPAFRSDLNNALAAVVSNNSGATEPTTMFAHQIWVDTAADPSILKIRNADNDAWITIGTINQTADTFTLTSAVSATTLNTSGAVVFNDAGADVDFRVEGDTEANLLFVDASTDRVGIGTSSPSQKLEVAGNIFINTSGNPTMTVKTSGAGNNPSYRLQADTTYWDIGASFSDATDPLTFSYGGSEKMRLDFSGNLLVGTTSAQAKLTIADNTSPRISCRGSGGTKANGATLVIPITGGGGCIVMIHNVRTSGANQFTSTVFAVCGQAGQGYAITQLSTKDGDAGKSFTLVQNGANAELLFTNTGGESCDVAFSVIGM